MKISRKLVVGAAGALGAGAAAIAASVAAYALSSPAEPANAKLIEDYDGSLAAMTAAVDAARGAELLRRHVRRGARDGRRLDMEVAGRPGRAGGPATLRRPARWR